MGDKLTLKDIKKIKKTMDKAAYPSCHFVYVINGRVLHCDDAEGLNEYFMEKSDGV